MTDLLLLLRDAVEDAIRADQPVGLVVSGGLDSSTVTTLALGLDSELPTFTGFYDVPGFDERKYARLVAGNEHHEIEIRPDDVIQHFDDVMANAPEPLQGPGMIGQYLVAKAASQHIRVAVSGEGSDELFGGYARLMHVAGEPMPDGYEHYQPPADYPTDLEAALDYDLRNLPDLLKVDDAMCAAWQIEARAPFTHSSVVEYGLNLPPRERVGKNHLRHAVRGLVPDQIIDRRDKKGFPIPLVHWAQGPLREFFMDRIGYIPDPADPFTRSYWNDLRVRYVERLAA